MRKRKRKRVSENEHRCSARWDEVPAVAGVRSIQKRQQSAPPYYVFSSDPYSFLQLPPLLLVAHFQPAALCLATTPLLRYAPDSLFHFRPPTVIPSYRNSKPEDLSEWKFLSRGILIDFFLSLLSSLSILHFFVSSMSKIRETDCVS